MSNNTTVNNTYVLARWFILDVFVNCLQAVNEACKQLTKTDRSKHPDSEYYEQLCCCSSICYQYQFNATMSLYNIILTHVARLVQTQEVYSTTCLRHTQSPSCLHHTPPCMHACMCVCVCVCACVHACVRACVSISSVTCVKSLRKLVQVSHDSSHTVDTDLRQTYMHAQHTE